MTELKDQYKLLLKAYKGINLLDEYNLKLYVLNDLKDYIDKFLISNNMNASDYYYLEDEINNESIKELLLSSVEVLNMIKGPIDLIILIKQKIKNKEYN